MMSDGKRGAFVFEVPPTKFFDAHFNNLVYDFSRSGETLKINLRRCRDKANLDSKLFFPCLTSLQQDSFTRRRVHSARGNKIEQTVQK